MAGARCVIEYRPARVSCPVHGVRVEAVPWAQAGSGFTRFFEQHVAYSATRMTVAAVAAMTRVAWRSVIAVVDRWLARGPSLSQRTATLRRIGIDEVSYRRGQRYLTVVVDHDTRTVVWAAPGRSIAVLEQFFTALGPTRCARITHVSADAATWISTAVRRHAPNAVQCMDAFHVAAEVTTAAEQVRRTLWNTARAQTATLTRTHPGGRTSQVSTGEATYLKRVSSAIRRRAHGLSPYHQQLLEHARKHYTRPDLGLGAEGITLPDRDRRQHGPRR